MKVDMTVIQKAADAVPKRPGLSLGQFRQGGSRGSSGDGTLAVDYDGQRRVFSVQVRRHLQSAWIDRLIVDNQDRDADAPLLVVSDQVGTQHADTLIKAGIAFMDTAGNVFLDLPGLYLSVTGKRAPDPVRKPNPGRAFQPSGLKLISACLTDPFLDKDPSKALINQQFRTIQQQAGVSLGSIGWILGDLQDTGFIVEDGKRRLLFDRAKLVQKWTDNYIDRLRPKQDAGRYSAPSQDWWQHVDLNAPQQLWGGEVAAAKLTGFLKPQQTTIYITAQPNDLILDAGLRLSMDGDVQMLHSFCGNWAHAAHDDCVHPLLVYADLLASNIDRNMETARRVYDRYLRDIVEPA